MWINGSYTKHYFEFNPQKKLSKEDQQSLSDRQKESLESRVDISSNHPIFKDNRLLVIFENFIKFFQKEMKSVVAVQGQEASYVLFGKEYYPGYCRGKKDIDIIIFVQSSDDINRLTNVARKYICENISKDESVITSYLDKKKYDNVESPTYLRIPFGVLDLSASLISEKLYRTIFEVKWVVSQYIFYIGNEGKFSDEEVLDAIKKGKILFSKERIQSLSTPVFFHFIWMLTEGYLVDDEYLEVHVSKFEKEVLIYEKYESWILRWIRKFALEHILGINEEFKTTSTSKKISVLSYAINMLFTTILFFKTKKVSIAVVSGIHELLNEICETATSNEKEQWIFHESKKIINEVQFYKEKIEQDYEKLREKIVFKLKELNFFCSCYPLEIEAKNFRRKSLIESGITVVERGGRLLELYQESHRVFIFLFDKTINNIFKNNDDLFMFQRNLTLEPIKKNKSNSLEDQKEIYGLNTPLDEFYKISKNYDEIKFNEHWLAFIETIASYASQSPLGYTYLKSIQEIYEWINQIQKNEQIMQSMIYPYIQLLAELIEGGEVEDYIELIPPFVNKNKFEIILLKYLVDKINKSPHIFKKVNQIVYCLKVENLLENDQLTFYKCLHTIVNNYFNKFRGNENSKFLLTLIILLNFCPHKYYSKIYKEIQSEEVLWNLLSILDLDENLSQMNEVKVFLDKFVKPLYLVNSKAVNTKLFKHYLKNKNYEQLIELTISNIDLIIDDDSDQNILIQICKNQPQKFSVLISPLELSTMPTKKALELIPFLLKHYPNDIGWLKICLRWISDFIDQKDLDNPDIFNSCFCWIIDIEKRMPSKSKSLVKCLDKFAFFAWSLGKFEIGKMLYKISVKHGFFEIDKESAKLNISNFHSTLIKSGNLCDELIIEWKTWLTPEQIQEWFSYALSINSISSIKFVIDWIKEDKRFTNCYLKDCMDYALKHALLTQYFELIELGKKLNILSLEDYVERKLKVYPSCEDNHFRKNIIEAALEHISYVSSYSVIEIVKFACDHNLSISSNNFLSFLKLISLNEYVEIRKMIPFNLEASLSYLKQILKRKSHCKNDLLLALCLIKENVSCKELSLYTTPILEMMIDSKDEDYFMILNSYILEEEDLKKWVTKLCQKATDANGFIYIANHVLENSPYKKNYCDEVLFILNIYLLINLTLINKNAQMLRELLLKLRKFDLESLCRTKVIIIPELSYLVKMKNDISNKCIDAALIIGFEKFDSNILFDFITQAPSREISSLLNHCFNCFVHQTFIDKMTFNFLDQIVLFTSHQKNIHQDFLESIVCSINKITKHLSVPSLLSFYALYFPLLPKKPHDIEKYLDDLNNLPNDFALILPWHRILEWIETIIKNHGATLKDLVLPFKIMAKFSDENCNSTIWVDTTFRMTKIYLQMLKENFVFIKHLPKIFHSLFSVLEMNSPFKNEVLILAFELLKGVFENLKIHYAAHKTIPLAFSIENVKVNMFELILKLINETFNLSNDEQHLYERKSIIIRMLHESINIYPINDLLKDERVSLLQKALILLKDEDVIPSYISVVNIISETILSHFLKENKLNEKELQICLTIQGLVIENYMKMGTLKYLKMGINSVKELIGSLYRYQHFDKYNPNAIVQYKSKDYSLELDESIIGFYKRCLNTIISNYIEITSCHYGKRLIVDELINRYSSLCSLPIFLVCKKGKKVEVNLFEEYANKKSVKECSSLSLEEIKKCESLILKIIKECIKGIEKINLRLKNKHLETLEETKSFSTLFDIYSKGNEALFKMDVTKIKKRLELLSKSENCLFTQDLLSIEMTRQLIMENPNNANKALECFLKLNLKTHTNKGFHDLTVSRVSWILRSLISSEKQYICDFGTDLLINHLDKIGIEDEMVLSGLLGDTLSFLFGKLNKKFKFRDLNALKIVEHYLITAPLKSERIWINLVFSFLHYDLLQEDVKSQDVYESAVTMYYCFDLISTKAALISPEELDSGFRAKLFEKLFNKIEEILKYGGEQGWGYENTEFLKEFDSFLLRFLKWVTALEFDNKEVSSHQFADGIYELCISKKMIYDIDKFEYQKLDSKK